MKPLTLFGVCAICHGKKLFAGLPDDEKDRFLRSIIPERYMVADVNHFKPKFIEKILAIPTETGLFLWGPTGRGKTYLMAALMKHYTGEGYRIERTNYEMLCLNIRDTFKSNGKTELDVILPFLDADKLFIEDVGTTKSEGHQETDFSVRTFFVLLDTRIEHCLPTYITTNRPLEELARTFDARIASRIKQGCKIFNIKGEDKRETKKGM